MASIAFSPCAQCATVCSSSIISVRTERIELVLPRTLHFSLCRWQAPSTSRACLVEPVQVVPAGSVHGDTTMMGDPFCRLLDSHMFLLFSHDRARIDNFAVKVSSGGAQTSVSAQSTGAQSHAVATQKFLTTASMVVRGVRSGCWGSLSHRRRFDQSRVCTLAEFSVRLPNAQTSLCVWQPNGLITLTPHGRTQAPC